MFVQSVFGQFHFVIFRLNLAFPNPGHGLNILQMKKNSYDNQTYRCLSLGKLARYVQMN